MNKEDLLALLLLLVPYRSESISQTLTRGVQLGLISPHQMDCVLKSSAFLWQNALDEYNNLTRIK